MTVQKNNLEELARSVQKTNRGLEQTLRHNQFESNSRLTELTQQNQDLEMVNKNV